MAANTPPDRSSLRNLGWMMLVIVIALSLPATRLALHIRRCRLVDSLGTLTTESAGPEWLEAFERKQRLFVLRRPVRASIDVDGRHVPDDLFLSLAQMESLTRLSFYGQYGTDLNDDRLLQLKPLRNLKSLTLCSVGVTWRGLAVLDSFTNLKTLIFLGTDVDDRALVPISHATELETLWLSQTAITDVGLPQLTTLRKLRVLHLNHTQIHDDGLKALAGLTSLEELNVSGTAVTDEGLSALRAALPALEITDD